MADKLEGVALAEVLDEIEQDLFKAKKIAVTRVLHGIYNDIMAWEAEMTLLEKKRAELTGKMKSARDKLVAIRSGDWNQVPNWSKPDDKGAAKANAPATS